MEEGFVNVNTVPTRVISIGGWIDQPVEKRNLILIIPGKLQYTSYHIYIHAIFFFTCRKSWIDWLL